MSCHLCTHPERNEFEDRIGNGSLLRKQAAKLLGCTADEVNTHMETHLGTTQSQIMNPGMTTLEEVFNERDVLMNNIDGIITRLNDFRSVAQFSKSDTDQIIAMSAEVRKTVETLAKLDGRLKEEQHITIQHYNDLKQFIFTGMCPTCRDMMQQQLTVGA